MAAVNVILKVKLISEKKKMCGYPEYKAFHSVHIYIYIYISINVSSPVL